ncbi:MAG: hypothetical protein LBQ76_03465 [Candidatus Fibromonas sp.]|jgi:hypothetical protein|nr:hypothetical protein [Candidatus Fibromonas sp.]
MLNTAVTKELFAEIENLPEENVGLLRQFLQFLKYRTSDSTYLASIPGMSNSIRNGVNTPLSECVPLEKVWPDV